MQEISNSKKIEICNMQIKIYLLSLESYERTLKEYTNNDFIDKFYYKDNYYFYLKDRQIECNYIISILKDEIKRLENERR